MSYPDLDRKSKRILEALYNHGGEAETGEIKDYTGIDKNGVVHYRINEKLEPKGLVETRTVEDGDRSLGVKITTLTDDGKRVVEKVLDDGDGPSLVDRVEFVESEFEALRDTVDNYEGHLHEAIEKSEEAEEAAAEIEAALDRVSALADDVAELRKRVEIVEDQPFEEVAEAKIKELRRVAQQVEQADHMNADVRRTLRQHGILSATRKKVNPNRDAETEVYTSSANTMNRDAYEAGPVLESLSGSGSGARSKGGDKLADKLARLDESGGLDALIEAAESGALTVDGGSE